MWLIETGADKRRPTYRGTVAALVEKARLVVGAEEAGPHTRREEEILRFLAFHPPLPHMSGMLINSRSEERDFALGRGPDPATRDNATGGAGGGEANTDPLAGGN